MTWADLSKEEDVHFQHSAHAHVDSKVNHAMNTFIKIITPPYLLQLTNCWTKTMVHYCIYFSKPVTRVKILAACKLLASYNDYMGQVL